MDGLTTASTIPRALERARKALEGSRNGEDEGDIAGLIADLLHLADAEPRVRDGYEGMGGEAVAETALMHYRAEREDV